MKILAIETSCDDTGIAILDVKKGGFNVLANEIASQIEAHRPYGGVYPFLAKREHIKNLPVVLEKALAESKIKNPAKELDFLAVTNGPGLEPCLWTGVNFVQELSKKWGLPIVPVDHIESHILVNYLNNPKIKFPALALVVSGGHTQLILVKGIGKYKILGETRDDAAGECFDKCAKLLGLGYPGGPEISKLAEGIVSKNIFPRPMISTKDYDFSFSGLKTAVLYYLQKNPNADKKEVSAEVQQAIIDVLIKKTIKAAKDFKIKTIILGGGVSANKELKKQMAEKINSELSGVDFLFPQVDHSTDNGLMTAVAAYFHKNKKASWKTLKANANLRISR
jgi:N6-L-threonylcarbamoyladenine synthase